MLWFIALGLIGLIFGILSLTDQTDYLMDKVMDFIIPIFIGVAVGAISAFLIGAVATWVSPTKTANWDIATVADNQGTHGSFSLFGGTVEDRPVFYYYRINGSVRTLERVEAWDAEIYEDSDSPYFTCQYKNAGKSIWWFSMGPTECRHYKFHVPAGSITTKVVLDAQ